MNINLPTKESIGDISLNVSTVLYLIFLVPQLMHNLRRKQTKGLSLWMHGILFSAYIADLVYGFGRDMEWQYKLVTLTGLFLLSIQHFQIYFYQTERSSDEHKAYWFLSAFLILLLGLSVYAINENILGTTELIMIGSFSQLGWFTYAIPQIASNYFLKSTKAVSIHFVLLGILMTFCDIVSAWALNWDLPNKIGSPLLLLIKLTLLRQFLVYKNNQA